MVAVKFQVEGVVDSGLHDEHGDSGMSVSNVDI